MHIAEGIITGLPALFYTAAGVGLVGTGASEMKKFVKEQPEKKPLLGMSGAFIFFLSLIPIPAFTGTCSHPCGSPLAGIILGPRKAIAITGLTLLLQAAFFAHGGFSTWGANVITLGVGGAFFAWITFRLCLSSGIPVYISAALGGLAGDIMTYVIAGLSLGTVLSFAPSAQYSFNGYLAAIYLAYLPTQAPIALLEMVVTGVAVYYIHKQRPEILEDLKVISGNKNMASAKFLLFLWLISSFYLFPLKSWGADNEEIAQSESILQKESENKNIKKKFQGMDDSVNKTLAEKAGAEPKPPYIDTEESKELWNALLLLGGAVSGFIIGRWWHTLFDTSAKL